VPHAALRSGSIKTIRADEQPLIFERSANGQRLRCAFNLSGLPVEHDVHGKILVRTRDLDGGVLGPYSAVIEEIA
jgi:hypothetical protein